MVKVKVLLKSFILKFFVVYVLFGLLIKMNWELGKLVWFYLRSKKNENVVFFFYRKSLYILGFCWENDWNFVCGIVYVLMLRVMNRNIIFIIVFRICCI